MKIITSRDQIPEHMSDTEAAEFWSHHTLSDELLEASIIVDEDNDLPKRKSATISIRLDEDLLQRIRLLAKIRNKGYQTLIKEFLIERTYEEEKKASRLGVKKLNAQRTAEQQSLERQLEIAFEKLQSELSQLVSGTIVMQIRDNQIGRFGVRTLPLEEKVDNGEAGIQGLTASQQHMLMKQAIEALKFKTNWSYGEIQFDFVWKNNEMSLSVQFESNYNLPITHRQKNSLRDIN